MALEGDEWKTADEGFKPSPADMVKFAYNRARLLIDYREWDRPAEIMVTASAANGDYFAAGGGWMCVHNWMKTRDVRILCVLDMGHPRPTPKETETAKNKPLTADMIDNVWKELGGGTCGGDGIDKL